MDLFFNPQETSRKSNLFTEKTISFFSNSLYLARHVMLQHLVLHPDDMPSAISETLAYLHAHGKPMRHAGDQVIQTGKRCMNHFHLAIEGRSPRLQRCTNRFPTTLVTWDRLPAELRVVILTMRNRMRHNAQIIIYRNVVRWILYTRAFNACDVFLDTVNEDSYDPDEVQLVDDDGNPWEYNKVIVTPEYAGTAVMFWLGRPLPANAAKDLEAEGYENFDEDTFHIEPRFLNDDRNLHAIDRHEFMGEGQDTDVPGVVSSG